MQTENQNRSQKTPNNPAGRGWMRRLVRILSGEHLRKGKELEKVMRFWHREETIALARASESLECRNYERWAMWMARGQEARLRCNKDFRRPLMELTGKPDLFDANAKDMGRATGSDTTQ